VSGVGGGLKLRGLSGALRGRLARVRSHLRLVAREPVLRAHELAVLDLMHQPGAQDEPEHERQKVRPELAEDGQQDAHGGA